MAVPINHASMESFSPPGPKAVDEAMSGQSADRGYFDFQLGKKGRRIVVSALVTHIDTGVSLSRTKTIGIIATRFQNDILQAACSGWTAGASVDEKCLDSCKWSHAALHQIAPLLRFHFPGNQRDNGPRPAELVHKGRAQASHVEVLLASWYAVEMLRRVYPDAPEEWLVSNLRQLKDGVAIGRDRRSAVITIDSQPCRTCYQYVSRLGQYTGIHFFVNSGAGVGPTIVRVEGRRRYDTFGDVFEDSEVEVEDEDEDELVIIHSDDALDDPDANIDTWSVVGSDITMRVEESPARAPTARYPHKSRIPENHLELIASYKKKTPVYRFPGYNSEVPARRPPYDSMAEDENMVVISDIDMEEMHEDMRSQETGAREVEAPVEARELRFDHWRHQPARQNASALQDRFPFLRSRFGIL